jgi:hypothetical protein
MSSVLSTVTAHEWLSQILGPPGSYIPPRKRYRYLNQKNHQPELEPIFDAFAQPEIPRGCIAALARRKRIPATSLRTWTRNPSMDKTAHPSRAIHALNDRIFTDDQEGMPLNRIESQFLQRGRDYGDADSKLGALAFHQELVDQHEALSQRNPTHIHPKIPAFVCSPSRNQRFGQ